MCSNFIKKTRYLLSQSYLRSYLLHSTMVKPSHLPYWLDTQYSTRVLLNTLRGLTLNSDVVLLNSLTWYYSILWHGVTQYSGVVGSQYSDVVLLNTRTWCISILECGVTQYSDLLLNTLHGLTLNSDVVLLNSLTWCYSILLHGVTQYSDVVGSKYSDVVLLNTRT